MLACRNVMCTIPHSSQFLWVGFQPSIWWLVPDSAPTLDYRSKPSKWEVPGIFHVRSSYCIYLVFPQVLEVWVLNETFREKLPFHREQVVYKRNGDIAWPLTLYIRSRSYQVISSVISRITYPLVLKHGWLENHLWMEAFKGRSPTSGPFCHVWLREGRWPSSWSSWNWSLNPLTVSSNVKHQVELLNLGT